VTDIGLCHNANYPATRLTADAIKRYQPRHARTITYWNSTFEDSPDPQYYWRQTLATCRQLADLGVTNLVVFNTEAYGGSISDTELMMQRLHDFLLLAKNEYGSPVHTIEPLNEIDTDGWTDGQGKPLTAELIVDYTLKAHSVAFDMFGIEVLSPSFLGGPQSAMPVAVLGALRDDGRIKTVAYHMYGRSVNGQPSPGWIWGTVEQGIEELLPSIGDEMLIDLTEGGCWTQADGMGEDAQRRFVEAVCAFQHPRVRRSYLFAYNDGCCNADELAAGKDFGLETADGHLKPAAHAFRGGLLADQTGVDTQPVEASAVAEADQPSAAEAEAEAAADQSSPPAEAEAEAAADQSSPPAEAEAEAAAEESSSPAEAVAEATADQSASPAEAVAEPAADQSSAEQAEAAEQPEVEAEAEAQPAGVANS
jgi:hypothetical protein